MSRRVRTALTLTLLLAFLVLHLRFAAFVPSLSLSLSSYLSLPSLSSPSRVTSLYLRPFLLHFTHSSSSSAGLGWARHGRQERGERRMCVGGPHSQLRKVSAFFLCSPLLLFLGKGADACVLLALFSSLPLSSRSPKSPSPPPSLLPIRCLTYVVVRVGTVQLSM